MFKRNKIKIYTHHRKYLNVSTGINKIQISLWPKILSIFFAIFYYSGYAVIYILNFFKKTVYSTCFSVGNGIIKFVASSFKTLKTDILRTRLTFPKRLELLFGKKFNSSLITFLIISIVGVSFLGSLRLVAKALDIKNKIINTAFIGNIYLNQAKNSLSEQDFANAENNFILAYRTFNKGENDIKSSGEALNKLLSIIPQKKDADRLLKAASLISEAGNNFIFLEKNISYLKLTSAGISSDGSSTKDAFKNINELIQIIQNKITSASEQVNKVNPDSLPNENKEAFLDLRAKLNIANLAINNFKQLFSLGQNILIGDKKILLLFENNNELRASGGFMGTFGALTVKDGSITDINVSSIYDLDGQLKEVIQPPQPVLNVSDKWYLRDSNWFADFPTTAKKISSFYEKEGGETPDIIIAVTPNLIIDWLKITGPIEMPKYNIILNQENFVETTQVTTTLSNDLSTNAPKQILADLVPILLQKISELDTASWAGAIEAVQKNLNSKHIAIYTRDKTSQSQLEAFNWTGGVKASDRDYLSVISSNLGGTKTDLYIDQKLNLVSTINNDGTLTNELTITRTNKLPDLDKTKNLSFIRVYVPQGSKLLSNIGFDFKNLEYPQNLKYKIDDDVYELQKYSMKDVVSGTMIGQESGKTFFGNWLELAGGETKTVKLTYTLPYKLSSIDRQSLMLQKQMGTQNYNLTYSLNFSGYKISWKNFDPNLLNINELNSDIILDKDYFFGLVLEKR